MIAFSHELTSTSKITDQTWEALAEHLDVAQMVELTFVVAMWNMTNRLNNVFGTELEADQRGAREMLFGSDQVS